jgi:hypothetical protein
MRKLVFGDLFNAAKVIKQANLKSELTEFIKKGQEKDVDIEELGIEVIMTVVESCGNNGVDQAFYEFLSGPFEMKADEIKNLPLNELIDKFKQLVQENDLVAFFKLAVK